MDTNYFERSGEITPDFTTQDSAGGKLGKAGVILVPLDGSGLAERSLAHAISMAAATSSTSPLTQ